MFFRTQRTLSENILMIFDPLPVKFLPQKKLLIWAKNSHIFCSKLPRSQKWRYQEFLLDQKMAKEGSKNQKKNFSQKKYSKDGKNKFWDLWDHNFIFRKSPDGFRTLTLPPYPPRTVPRSRPYMVYWSLVFLWWPVYIGRKIRPRKIFYIDFDGQKIDFFCFLENIA